MTQICHSGGYVMPPSCHWLRDLDAQIEVFPMSNHRERPQYNMQRYAHASQCIVCGGYMQLNVMQYGMPGSRESTIVPILYAEINLRWITHVSVCSLQLHPASEKLMSTLNFAYMRGTAFGIWSQAGGVVNSWSCSMVLDCHVLKACEIHISNACSINIIWARES